MHLLASLLLCIVCGLSCVSANVEKVIFVAPEPLGKGFPGLLDSPHFEHLSHSQLSLRRQLHARFPDSPLLSEQQEAWIILEDLKPGQRYEVRVCWSATQPTEFNLSVHNPTVLLDKPTLQASLQRYLAARSNAPEPSTKSGLAKGHWDDQSVLLFYISAAADYFTLDQKLMQEGQLVTVDIILDPFLLNIFPKSLGPTAIYISTLAIIAWFLSSYIANALQHLARSTPGASKSDHQISQSDIKKTL